MTGELLDPPAMRFVAKIGEDDDIRDLTNPPKRLGRARNQCLPVHFVTKKTVEQRPDLIRRNRLAARFVGEGRGEFAAFQVKVDPVRLVEPFFEMRDHMQQHLVAIGDQERPAQRSNSRRAMTSCSGSMETAPAMAIRSGS